MRIEYLNKLVDHEINWIKYYGLRETRNDLTKDSDLYTHLKSIGYTKRVISLDKRCACGSIKLDSDLDKLVLLKEYRNPEQNQFTPLEIYWKLFEDKREEIISRIKD